MHVDVDDFRNDPAGVLDTVRRNQTSIEIMSDGVRIAVLSSPEDYARLAANRRGVAVLEGRDINLLEALLGVQPSPDAAAFDWELEEEAEPAALTA